MNNFKRRVAICMSFILAFVGCLVTLPGSRVEALADVSKSMYFDNNLRNYMTDTNEMQVEAGQTVQLGGYIKYYYYNFDTSYYLNKYLIQLSGDTYTSSVPSVAAIDTKTGKLVTKKAGTTVVTVKYKGLEEKITIIVKSKGSLGTGKSKYKNLNKYSLRLLSENPLKITSKNRYDINNNKYLLSQQLDKFTSISDRGFANQKKNGMVSTTNALVLPNMYVYAIANDTISEYADKYTPIGTRASKAFKIKTASGKGDTIKVTLTKSVTATQIFAINKSTNWDTETLDTKQAGFAVYVQDIKTGHKYYGIATVTKGSKNMTITLVNNTLKNGRKYRLISTMKGYEDKYGWTKGKTFKATK